MNEINISLNEVKEVANTIRSYNNQLDEILNNTKRIIQELNEYWLSEASENYQIKYAEFTRLYENIHSDIDTYASFLNHTVESYESIDSTIASNAKEIY